MPKVIKNLRENILAEIGRQLNANGYRKTTVRSIAAACGVGIGTVYNYFISKDVMIATYMLAEWEKIIDDIKRSDSSDPYTSVKNIYRALITYIETNHVLFSDRDAMETFISAFNEKHTILRNQIADLLGDACKNSPVKDKAFLSKFISEAIITCAREKVPFEKIYDVISILLITKK